MKILWLLTGEKSPAKEKIDEIASIMDKYLTFIAICILIITAIILGIKYMMGK